MNNQTVNYIFNITGNANQVVSGISQEVSVLNQKLSQTTNVFDSFKGGFVALQGLTSVVQNVQTAIGGITQVGANAELQLMNMKTLFGGNAEAASDMYKRISEYGKVTPYDKAGLIDAQKTMMSFGISGESAFKTLQQIGDIAMGDSQKMQSLSLAFAQMSSTGKLTGQDLLQMINAGFNPLNEISKETGKSVAELKEEMSKGAISADMVSKAFSSATSEGGLFYKAIDEASQTTAGKMAAIQDTIDEIKVSIFNATGDFGLWVDAAAKMAVPLAQLSPLFEMVTNIGKGFSFLKVKALSAYTTLGMYNGYLSVGKVENLGFRKNVIQAAVAVGRFATVGLFNAIKGMGAYVLSLVTGGAMSQTFSGIASASFKAFALAAKTAIASIPIVGWIAIAITAIASLTAYLYTEFESVRNFLDGFGGRVLSIFFPIIGLVASFAKHWDSIKTAFTDGGIIAGLKRIGFVLIDAMLKPVQGLLELLGKIPGMGKLAGKGADWIQGLRDGLDKATYVPPKEEKKEEKEKADVDILGKEPTKDTTNKTTPTVPSNLGDKAGTSAGKAQQITINLNSNMVGTMNFTGGLQENARDVEAVLREQMARILGMAATSV